MKIAHINTYDKDGGAAKAALRLNQGLNNIGVDSHFIVQVSSGEGKMLGAATQFGKLKAVIRPHIDKFPLKSYPKRSSYFSVNWLSNSAINSVESDIINLHWINDGFIGLENISRINRPIVWTLHDSWAFTGGCHLPYNCEKYQSGCGKCPLLHSETKNDLTSRIWKKKKKVLSRKNDITIVTPSKWLQNKSSESELLKRFQVFHIPNGVNTSVFKPISKDIARDILNLPKDKKIILFGASGATADPNKGYAYFKQLAVELQKAKKEDVQLVVFGGKRPKEDEDIFENIIFLGKVADEVTLSIIYNSADIFVSTSKSENLPNTIMESMSCGTPCIAFNVGGIEDLVIPNETGILIQPFDVKEMLDAIISLISDFDKYRIFSENCRNIVVNYFEIDKIATKYQNLYQTILDKK